MTKHTPAEARARNIGAMGNELGAIYSELWQELAWLHSKWAEYVVLFGTRKSRVDLMNEAAPLFTRIVQDSLWDDMLIHIARLTDPPKSAGRDNVTFKRLPAIVDAAIKADLEAKIGAAEAASGFARDWRNRRIAHNDYAHALDRVANPLEPASRLSVKEALAALVAVLNTVSQRYLDAMNVFDMGRGLGGAMALLHVVDDGVQVKRARAERIKAGQFDPDDFKPRDL